ncbi:hypothetical protein [Paenibacillus xerothermodurans]|uniref:Uncharacterized protein n=1 Tax=Paenibacillus xerothermodurans TaxID=1977292 RepID=A0A2W1NGE2_PAEXE|nr:hypothetical protein [Paenibacillus xerothermodurans]PZE22151.1 hypothetical protein CBW46_007175 [Paenibacillus xerothermodurans]
MANQDNRSNLEERESAPIPKLTREDLSNPTEGVVYGSPGAAREDAVMHNDRARSAMEAAANEEQRSGSSK